MNGFILCYKYKKSGSSEGSGSSSGSDLVALGILEKPISDFTNADIGTEISIPYTDAGGVIRGPIVFEVVGVNHHTTTEYQKTITLMTKNIIRKAAFDAAEPNNTNSDRKNGGNNRWSVSNIRQWLNSDGAAGKWFTAQHEYDASPTSGNVSSADSAYADAPGFLAGFSDDLLQHFTDITNITALHSVDGGVTETTVDKVFLPSYTEMGFVNSNGTAEGSHLSVRYPNANSRIKQWNGSADIYWTRSPYRVKSSAYVYFINAEGNNGSGTSYTSATSNFGIAPIIVLH